MARKTPLGWLLFGGEDPPASSSAECFGAVKYPRTPLDAYDRDDVHFHPMPGTVVGQSVEEKFDLLLRREFLTPDGIRRDPLQVHMSYEDRQALIQVSGRMFFDQSLQKYSCPLPLKWSKERTAELLRTVDSHSNARQRLLNYVPKMSKVPEMAEALEKEIRKMEGNGWCRKLDKSEIETNNPIFYIPLHIVKQAKAGAPGGYKYRLCFDGASQPPSQPHPVTIDGVTYKKGFALNDFLLVGPDLVCRLQGILLRLRANRVCYSSDIEAFFLQIRCFDDYATMFRFLWFEDYKNPKTSKIDIWQTFVHLFGAKSSPFISTYTLKRHIDDYGGPMSPETIQCAEDFYVDDNASCCRSIRIRDKVREELTACLKEGGFNLTKWKSPHPGWDDKTPNSEPEDRRKRPIKLENGQFGASIDVGFVDEDADVSYFEEDKTDDIGKVLGLGHCNYTDSFVFRVSEPMQKLVGTMRGCLSLVCSFFDPLGIFSPYILKGRQLAQEATATGLKWDERLPESLLQRIENWRQGLFALQRFTMPRWESNLDCQPTENPKDDSDPPILVAYADASIKGLNCVIYRVQKGHSGKYYSSFKYSKSAVVPLQTQEKLKKTVQESHLNSIPRLELVAAKMMVEAVHMVVKETRERYEDIIYCSDSMVVVSQIHNQSARFDTFTNNRIDFIRTMTTRGEFLHVETHLNPADEGSRGLDPHEDWHRFLNGPSYLRTPRESWPQGVGGKTWSKMKTEKINFVEALCLYDEIVTDSANSGLEEELSEDMSIPDPFAETDDYIKDTIALSVTGEIEIDPEMDSISAHVEGVDEEAEISSPSDTPSTPSSAPRATDKVLMSAVQRVCKAVSSWHSKCYRIALLAKVGPALLRFLIEKKKKVKITKPDLLELRPSAKMILEAEMCIFKCIQRVHFLKEIKYLLKHRMFLPESPGTLKVKSPLIQFGPFLDEKGVIRAVGRIGKAYSIGYEQRHPILLPKNDSNVLDFIDYVHKMNLHSGVEATLNATRQRTWILQGRSQIKGRLNKCAICCRKKRMPVAQVMGNVPEARLQTVPPFSSTLCDLIGPLTVVRSGRKGNKAYVVTFTCGTYHAISFEIVFSLTADEFIMSLVRFVSRFPYGIKTLITDNASNFAKANSVLAEALESYKSLDLTNKSFNGVPLTGIQWEFGTPRTGWTTGKVERAIGMTKNLLFTMLSRETLEVEMLRTTLSQIELTLNTRPITRASSDPSDYNVLRPVDFLFSAPSQDPLTNVSPPTPVDLKQRWTQVRELYDQFVNRWKEEYLSCLIPRSKWTTEKPNLALNDLCVIKDQSKRDLWKVGRVVEIKNPNSIQIRRVILKLPDGKKLERHANSLVKLELD